MTGVMAGLKTENEEMLERFRAALQYRTEENLNIYEIDGMTLFSDQRIHSDGRYKVVFNGYLLDESEDPAKKVSEFFAEYNTDFPKKLEGSYRAAIYDSEKEEMFLITDKTGSKPLFYSKTGDNTFASHLSIFTAHRDIEPELDTAHLAHFLDHWALSSYGGRTFFRKVKRMFPASLKKIGDQRITYWDPDFVSKKNISDKEAVKDLKKLLKKSARLQIENAEGRPTLMLSGGSDSVFVASLLDEVSEKDIKTVTYGWSEEDLNEGEKASEELGFEHESVLFEKELPKDSEVWRYDWPSIVYTYDPYYRLKDKLDLENVFHGLSAEIPFPTGMKDIEKLDKLQKFQSSARIADKLQLTDLLHKFSPKRARGIDVLASQYDSSVVAASLNIRREDVEVLMSENLPKPVPEELMDKEFKIEGDSFYEKHIYLTLKARDVPRRGILSQSVTNLDIFTYTPLIEYTAALPVKQKRNARLMKKIGKETGWVPERIRNSSSSGSSYVTDTFRKRMISDRESYDQAIESFLERGFMDREKARRELMPQSFEEVESNKIFFAISVYILEKYLQQYIDREKPWKPPN